MLDISLGMLIFVAVLFLGLIYLLNEMLYKPLLAFMDKREKSIRDDLAMADKNDDDIQKDLEDANAKISVAKVEAAKIREDAMAKAKEAASKALSEGKESFESKYVSFVNKLSKDQVALKKSISLNLPSYQDGISAKIKNI
jgi:F-type H+-transporting ATPase subunit b